MGDYDYLNPRVPPPRESDDSVFADDTGTAPDISSGNNSITSPMQFADGATRMVTFHPSMPNPADPDGPGGPAIIIHANPVAAPSGASGAAAPATASGEGGFAKAFDIAGNMLDAQTAGVGALMKAVGVPGAQGALQGVSAVTAPISNTLLGAKEFAQAAHNI